MSHRSWIRLAFATTALVATSLGIAAVSTAAGQGSPGRVAGSYALASIGDTACVPLPRHPERLECQTTGFASTYDGDLDGTSTIDFAWVIDCAKGRSTGEGVERFVSAETADRMGTLTWTLRFRSDFDCETFAPSGLDAHGTITAGDGDFAGAHGQLQFGDTSYEGQIH